MVDRNAPGAVFVGNISYDTTQDQLRALMQEVGPIKAIKLVLNRETGQHRGYGFVEYHSAAVAKSAMQNLAGRDLMGRKVRVDSANQNTAKATKVGRSRPLLVGMGAEEVSSVGILVVEHTNNGSNNSHTKLLQAHHSTRLCGILCSS